MYDVWNFLYGLYHFSDRIFYKSFFLKKSTFKTLNFKKTFWLLSWSVSEPQASFELFVLLYVFMYVINVQIKFENSTGFLLIFKYIHIRFTCLFDLYENRIYKQLLYLLFSSCIMNCGCTLHQWLYLHWIMPNVCD